MEISLTFHESQCEQNLELSTVISSDIFLFEIRDYFIDESTCLTQSLVWTNDRCTDWFGQTIDAQIECCEIPFIP